MCSSDLWPEEDGLEPVLPADELEPLAPPLLGSPPLEDLVVPAGGGMDVLVQAPSPRRVAASPTTQATVRCVFMQYCPLIRCPKV